MTMENSLHIRYRICKKNASIEEVLAPHFPLASQLPLEDIFERAAIYELVAREISVAELHERVLEERAASSARYKIVEREKVKGEGADVVIFLEGEALSAEESARELAKKRKKEKYVVYEVKMRQLSLGEIVTTLSSVTARAFRKRASVFE